MSRRLGIIAVVVAAITVLPAIAYAQKLVILVRHAERADGGAGAMTAQTDPPLSEAGEARALKLVQMLADSGVKAVFVTEYKRTQDTVKPLATKLGVTPAVVKAADSAALVAEIKSQHANDVVLVVGPSNTLPVVIKSLGGPDVTIADNDYDSLFVLVPSTGAFTRIRF